MSTDRKITETFVGHLKRRAKKMNRAPGVSHARVLDIVAVEAGFKNWQDVVAQHKAYVASKEGVSA